MASLTLVLNSKTTVNLTRRNSLSGGPEAPGSVYILTAIPNSSSSSSSSSSKRHQQHHHDKHQNPRKQPAQHNMASLSVIQLDRAPPGFQNPRNAATAAIPAQVGEVVKSGCTVFIKWGDDPERIRKLAHEAEVYSTELKHLQGSVVPRMYGHYMDRSVRPTFACTIFEYLSGSLPKEFHQYNQESTYLDTQIRDAGVIHRQLNEEDRRRHIIPSKQGLRVVDFTEARSGRDHTLTQHPSISSIQSRLHSEGRGGSSHRRPMVDIDGGPIRMPIQSARPSAHQQFLTVPPLHQPDFPGPRM